ncbi:MAG: ATP-binding domain-containing protein [Proteobacteria bacterium]|nr:ATP-binding domain-containing protein [Pseudomonadota bacterium]MCP4920000.1 ATP-binding domain-containing protein [Pseudomonadota bacterium]
MHPIVTEEESDLAQIRTKLLERPVETGASEKDIVEELLRIREELGGAKAEDLGSLMTQFDQLHALLGQIRRARKTEDVDPDSPYFAHMRLREDGKDRNLYLGKVTRIDHGLRIIDWRNAPIAQIFYRYQEGEEYAEEVGERILEGELVARRTVSISRGQLERIDSPQGTFVKDDGEWDHVSKTAPKLAGGQGASLLKHERGGRARQLGIGSQGRPQREDKHLPDIAALIDREQWDLITQPDSGLVVVRGTAGSGKTTVALHRVAYLAYQDPNRFRSNRMIVVVWGKALRDYISKVLPSLGVEGVEVVTWTKWARHQVRRHFPFLPKHIADDTPEIVSRMKLHPAFLLALQHQVDTVDNPPNADGVFEDFLGVFMDLDRLKISLQGSSFTAAEIERVWDWARRQRARLTDWIHGNKEERAELDAEDDAVLLRLWQLRVGKLRAKGRGKRANPLSYSHMVVDEVQDLSPLEVSVLLDTVDKRGSATLSGDTQQAIIEEAGFTDWGEMFGNIGLNETKVNTLKVSYRSTHQITSFARDVLGDLAEDDVPPMTIRPGAPVEMFRFTDHGACVGFLGEVLQQLARREPLASIAVLTPSPAISAMYADGLRSSDVPRLRLVRDQTFAFAAGVEVTEVNEVKGLEFDYVVLVEVSAQNYPDSAHTRRLLHVGATRAAHQLWITSVGTPSPILS